MSDHRTVQQSAFERCSNPEGPPGTLATRISDAYTRQNALYQSAVRRSLTEDPMYCIIDTPVEQLEPDGKNVSMAHTSASSSASRTTMEQNNSDNLVVQGEADGDENPLTGEELHEEDPSEEQIGTVSESSCRTIVQNDHSVSSNFESTRGSNILRGSALGLLKSSKGYTSCPRQSVHGKCNMSENQN